MGAGASKDGNGAGNGAANNNNSNNSAQAQANAAMNQAVVATAGAVVAGVDKVDAYFNKDKMKQVTGAEDTYGNLVRKGNEGNKQEHLLNLQHQSKDIGTAGLQLGNAQRLLSLDWGKFLRIDKKAALADAVEEHGVKEAKITEEYIGMSFLSANVLKEITEGNMTEEEREKKIQLALYASILAEQQAAAAKAKLVEERMKALLTLQGADVDELHHELSNNISLSAGWPVQIQKVALESYLSVQREEYKRQLQKRMILLVAKLETAEGQKMSAEEQQKALESDMEKAKQELKAAQKAKSDKNLIGAQKDSAELRKVFNRHEDTMETLDSNIKDENARQLNALQARIAARKAQRDGS